MHFYSEMTIATSFFKLLNSEVDIFTLILPYFVHNQMYLLPKRVIIDIREVQNYTEKVHMLYKGRFHKMLSISAMMYM